MSAVNKLTHSKRSILEHLPSLNERMASGKSQRLQTPREAHEEMASEKGRTDPVQLIIDSNAGRVEELVPIRYQRMLTSPFAFLRGSALVMAEDLSKTPASGIDVQCCGDCH